MMKNTAFSWISNPSGLPRLNWREAAYFAGDIRVIANRSQLPEPIVEKNELGEYYLIAFEFEGVFVKIIGHKPFADQEFTVLAEPENFKKAVEGVKQIFADINYHPEIVPNKWGGD